MHRRFDVEKTHDVAFVGNIFPGPRAELVRLLQGRFRSMFVGRAYFEEMARIYSAARLVFNRSLKNDVNMRVFEAVACGSLLLTNDLAENGQAELFRDGVHLATYRDGDELLDKAAYYLKHEALRERIAAAGPRRGDREAHLPASNANRAGVGQPVCKAARPYGPYRSSTANGRHLSPAITSLPGRSCLHWFPGRRGGCSTWAAVPDVWARRSRAASRAGRRHRVRTRGGGRARGRLDEVFEGDVERAGA